MTLIYLDIDGVLNDHRRDGVHGFCIINPELVQNLNVLLDQVPEAQIVISSAWRYLVLNGSMTVKGFESLLLSHGLHCYDRVIGITDADELYYENRERLLNDPHFGLSIRAQQIQNDLQLRQPARYIVIDDLAVPINGLVRTDGLVGLTMDAVNRAFNLLNYQ